MSRVEVEGASVSTGFRPECHFYCVPSGGHHPPGFRPKDSFLLLYWNNSLDAGPFVDVIMMTSMPRRRPAQPEDPKRAALRASGTLHPHPDAVRDETFLAQEFFDRRDRIQVKYEMLRRHRVDRRPVTEVADAYGVSRQAFYTAARALHAQGIAGLLPRPRGPKRAHKCTDEILDFVEAWHAEQPPDAEQTAAEAVEQRFGLTIHPRSLDRALVRRKKKRHTPRGAPS